MPGMSTNSKHTPTPNNETPKEIRSRLRAQAKKARSALAPETRASKSKQICTKLTQHLDALMAETPQGNPLSAYTPHSHGKLTWASSSTMPTCEAALLPSPA